MLERSKRKAYNVRELAEFLGVSESYLHKHAALPGGGDAPPYLKVGWRRIYLAEDVALWCAGRRVASLASQPVGTAAA